MQRIISIIMVLVLIFTMLFCGCSRTGYVVETDDNGNTTVYDSDGNVVASTEENDDITVMDDGTVVISNPDGTKTTLSSSDTTITNSQKGNDTVSKANTSDMDFSFSDEDISANDTISGTVLDVTKNTTTTSSGAKVYTINSGGSYILSGTINDIMIIIDTDNAETTLILKGATIKNNKGPAIYVRSAKKATITLANGTTSTLSDGSSYSIVDSNATLDSVIFSKSDLTVNGKGSLVVNGNYKHGIVSKSELIISSGTIKITSKNVGINGKDCVKINSGNININSGGDGVRSDNTQDTSKGYVYLLGGTVNITSSNDAIQAETVINIENVNLSIKSGGGSSSATSYASESYKGLKSGSDIYITNGTFNIDSNDDSIHSNGTITIKGGVYTISSGDDGIHADTDLSISGSSTKLTINKSYEALEATNVVIAGGNLVLKASDDGINVAGGNDSSFNGGNRPGQNNFSSSIGSLKVSEGTIYINANGDGIDANGSILISGGDITISGPDRGDTSILDFDTNANINGGTFIGTGTSGMTQNFSSSSTQGVIMIRIGSQPAGSTVTLKDSTGNVILTRTTDLPYSCIILSSPKIVIGKKYTITAGSYSTNITMNNIVSGH